MKTTTSKVAISPFEERGEPKNCIFISIAKLGCSQICGRRRRIEETYESYETENAEISLYDPKNPTP